MDALHVTERGDPNLTFPNPGPYIASGDLDADGDEDLIVPSQGTVSLLENLGDTEFTLLFGALDVIGASAYDISVSDLNGDGLLDLAVVVSITPDTAVNVLINEGGLSFADPVTYSADFNDDLGNFYFHNSIDAGDLDNDGDVDLVVGQENFQKFVILRNVGDGTFAPMEAQVVYDGPWVVELEDVSGDGWPDFIALTEPVRSGMRIYLNDGRGGLLVPDLFSVDGDLQPIGQHVRMEGGDLDGDGDADFAAVRRDTSIRLVENRSDGSFTIREEIHVPEPGDLRFVAIGDLDGDGLGDLVGADEGGTFEEPGNIWVLMNQGDFSFATLAPIVLDTEAYEVQLGDMDADGDLDAVAWIMETYPGDDLTPVDRRLMVLLNDGEGGLSIAQELVFDAQTWHPKRSLELGDIDADGDLDVGTSSAPILGDGLLTILTNDGSGTLSIAHQATTWQNPEDIRFRDLDGDDDLDLAVMFDHNRDGIDEQLEPYLVIGLNDGSGSFTITEERVDVNVISDGQLVAADFDGDESVDLAVPDVNGTFVLLLNDGSGAFGPGARYTGIDFHEAAAAVDADLDGRTDLLVGNKTGHELMLFRNLSCPACAADVNGDGSLDILDFIAFQSLWQAGEAEADCNEDDAFDDLDFVCLKERFLAGCP